jgi:endonuclease/exonuclease/phosphatase family metal-dependent hydrolase
VFEDPERGTSQLGELAARDGFHSTYFPAAPLGGGTIGNAVLSRYPIREAVGRRLPHADGTMGRVAVRADLELPEGRLCVFCVHLSHCADESYKREAQVAALDRFVREAPRDLPRILVGDFNADPDSTEIRFLTGKATLGGVSAFYQDAAAIRHAEAPTWAERNPWTAVFGEGDRRIDYVFVSHARPNGSGSVASCRPAFDRQDAAGNFASDHFGVFAEIRIGRGE